MKTWPCDGVADAKCVERFQAKVGEPDENGCQNWGGSVKSGHGQFRGGPFGEWKGRRPIGAHRFAWTLVNGPIPEGLVIRHRCDNGVCCNVEHMELGTQADNCKDIHDRFVTERGGEGNGMAKLTHQQAAEIYRLAHEGRIKQTKIAETFGVTPTLVTLIKTGRVRTRSVQMGEKAA
ncbi:hypothetical protein SEA_ESPERER_55 [Streptomyces phage Esperer]|uniref:HNH endonuclease n=3 Tax=Likavirus TaxID=1982880 RepID=A0A514U389_9CAUD|nr:endonuclease [Streptomyces phage Hydra]AKY03587.1 HNH endonuclease [Streptomyces phage Hydra]ATE85235.1 hypothetical protein SEA_ESPERER_55 [Streptomyces phage Esperer]QDK03420.1 HNH endonuclease [Streptomyces phage Leviticus]